MKTIILGTLLLLSCSTLSQAQESIITPKMKSIELGIFGEGGKTFFAPNKYDLTAPYHLAAGIAFRYRLSERFKIATGFAFAMHNTPYFAYENGKYFSHSDYVILGEKSSGQLLQLPIALQYHFCHQKFFVSAGFELFEYIHGTYYSCDSSKLTGVISESKVTVYSGLQGFDAQILAGFGWNFKAINNNQFSVETNLKIYPSSSYKLANSGTHLTPSLRLNWYIIN